MRIAITGSGGFLGAVFKRAVEQKGWTSVPVALPRDLAVEDDALPEHIINDAQADAFIHCAASLKPRSRQELFLNAHMPARLAEAFVESRRPNRFVFLSSYNVNVRSLKDRYSESKRAAERELEGLGVVILRPGLIWDWKGSGMAAMVAKLLTIPIPFRAMLAPGHTYRPVDAASLADYALTFLERDRAASHPIDILGDREYSLWDLSVGMADLRKRTLFRLPTETVAPLIPTALRDRLLAHELLQQLIPVDRSGGRAPKTDHPAVILPFTHWTDL